MLAHPTLEQLHALGRAIFSESSRIATTPALS